MNDNFTEAFGGFISALAFETNLSTDTATKVASWLKDNGVLDFPVLTEMYEGIRD